KVLPESPTTGDIVRTTIHKRLIRSVFGAPITLRTYIDDVLVAESAVGWDPRYQAPSTATSKLTAGTQLGNVKPNGGKIDGLGTPTGDWQSNGLAQQRATSVDLDPTGGTKKVTVNGTGDKTTYGQGGDARTLKISNSAVSKNIGETPEADIFETAGTTKALCP
ncbi:MAG TPA: hypothetical protein VFF06_06415, partial [Polyangia bacterium]|nr:hypothetical protein [Polyangia bacterium]